jgi:hypothetical protein
MNRGGWEGLDMSTIWLGMLLGLPLLEVTGWAGICSHQPNCSRWRKLLAMGAPDSVRCATGQRPVCRHVILLLGLGAGWLLEALSSCDTGQSGATPDNPVPLWPSALTSVLHCALLQSRPLPDSRCPAGTPDSPVNYSGAVPEKPEAAEFGVYSPSCAGHCPVVHWTVRCASPGHTSVSFAPLFWTLSFNFVLVCCEPLAPVEHII